MNIEVIHDIHEALPRLLMHNLAAKQFFFTLQIFQTQKNSRDTFLVPLRAMVFNLGIAAH